MGAGTLGWPFTLQNTENAAIEPALRAIEVTENTNRPLNQGYDGETRQELEEHLLTSIDTDPSDLPRWAKEEGITEPRASGAVSTIHATF